MRRFLFVLAGLAAGCSTDTFATVDGGDDGGGGDGGVDAPFDVASCGQNWCSAQPTSQNGSCTDFDESGSIPTDWTSETSSGSVNLTSSPAETCLSLHAYMPVITQTLGAFGRITRTFSVTGSANTSVHASLALDVRLPKQPANGLTYFFGIRANALTFGLAQRQDGTWYLEPTTNPSASAQLASQGPELGTFTHMELDLTYTPQAAAAHLSYVRSDGNPETVDANVSFNVLPTSVSFLVGLDAPTMTAQAIDSYYDDVVTNMSAQ